MYKYKEIKWNNKKSKVYDHDTDGNKPNCIGVYENKNSFIGRNNDITYRINEKYNYRYNKREGYVLEITIRYRRDILDKFNVDEYSRQHTIEFNFSTIEECKEKAEELNKIWNILK